MRRATLPAPERASLLALLLARLLDGRAPSLARPVRLRAAGMSVLVSPAPEGVELRDDDASPAGATVTGEVDELLALARGRAPLLPLLRGGLRVGGNPLLLLPLLAALRRRR